MAENADKLLDIFKKNDGTFYTLSDLMSITDQTKQEVQRQLNSIMRLLDVRYAIECSENGKLIPVQYYREREDLPSAVKCYRCEEIHRVDAKQAPAVYRLRNEELSATIAAIRVFFNTTKWMWTTHYSAESISSSLPEYDPDVVRKALNILAERDEVTYVYSLACENDHMYLRPTYEKKEDAPSSMRCFECDEDSPVAVGSIVPIFRPIDSNPRSYYEHAD